MPAAIKIENLYKTYSNGFQAVKGLNLTIQAGEFYALLGPNGAGKSTTIGMLTSVVNKTSGKIEIMGVDFDRCPDIAKSYLGVVPQEINLNIFETPMQILRYQAAYYGVSGQVVKKRSEFLLKQLDLWEKRNVQARMLSGGMKRRLMIARGLIHNPKILILDEPTAGVDVEIRQSMWRFLSQLNREGLTILLTTHYLEEAENLCRGIAIIDQGQVVTQTTVAELLKTLDSETFVFYTKEPLPSSLYLQGFEFKQIDAHTLEVEIQKGQVMSQVVCQLAEQGIMVESMRNKENRLERLFLNLVNKKRGKSS